MNQSEQIWNHAIPVMCSCDEDHGIVILLVLSAEMRKSHVKLNFFSK